MCWDLSDTIAKIEAAGVGAEAIRCDVSKESDVLDMFDNVRDTSGGLDILVHCAGIMHECPLLETSVDDFDRVMSINLRGTFMVGREALRLIHANPGGGAVILIASDLSYLGRAEFSPYVASKHAVMGFVRSWSKEFAPKVLVNGICPGPINTAMLEADNMSPGVAPEGNGHSPRPLRRIVRDC